MLTSRLISQPEPIMTTIATTSELPEAQVAIAQQQPAPRTGARRRLEWIGLLPFILFVLIFQLFPALFIVIRSFLSQGNQFTFANIEALNNPVIIQSMSSSLQVSFLSALTGCFAGFVLAWAITWGGISTSIRSAVLSFCGVAANFAGVPLVFAFVSAYGLTGILTGRQGVITQFLNSVGISLYPGFSIYNFWGLVVVYLFFQLPLMTLIMVPALAGLRREWREASENLGASNWQYWRFVALPILIPSILSAFALLFANAFGCRCCICSSP
jgi:putative spermidine/putrescine transport system permease protein